MDLKENWPAIRQHFRRSFSSNLHVSIASVSASGQPCSTPIGSFFLDEMPRAHYFEMYPKSLPEHAIVNPNICVLAVNSSKLFWLHALYRGRFGYFPGIKLYGQLGATRQATTRELMRLQRRMRFTKALRGHQYLWPAMKTVREVVFTRAEPIRFGEMTVHL